jgi:hypothetical protein
VQLKRESDGLHRRATAADSIADSLWSATWELDRLLAEVNSEHRDIESYLIESHLDDLRSTVAKLRHAQKAFREASH